MSLELRIKVLKDSIERALNFRKRVNLLDYIRDIQLEQEERRKGNPQYSYPESVSKLQDYASTLATTFADVRAFGIESELQEAFQEFDRDDLTTLISELIMGTHNSVILNTINQWFNEQNKDGQQQQQSNQSG